MFENRESEWLLANETAAKETIKAAIAVSFAYEFLKRNIWGLLLESLEFLTVFFDLRKTDIQVRSRGRRADSLEGLRSRWLSIGRDNT
jgi:hypothetical protein